MEKYGKELHIKESVFSTTLNPDEYPFWICQYGTTYKDVSYHQIRLDTNITCIEYILSGSGVVISNNRSFIVNKGDTYMLVQGSNVNYYSDPDDPFEKIWINVKGVLATQIIEIYKLQDVVLFHNTNTYDIIKDIHNICKTETNPQIIQDKVSGLFLNLIQFLYRSNTKSSAESNIIDLYRYYIDCHITENIKLSDIAEFSHITVGHLIRSFKKSYGMTPHQYIIDSKIKIAKTMLLATDNSVKKIAETLSFSDPHNFSSLFQKYTGERPSVFRKNHKSTTKNKTKKGTNN